MTSRRRLPEPSNPLSRLSLQIRLDGFTKRESDERDVRVSILMSSLKRGNFAQTNIALLKLALRQLSDEELLLVERAAGAVSKHQTEFNTPDEVLFLGGDMIDGNYSSVDHTLKKMFVNSFSPVDHVSRAVLRMDHFTLNDIINFSDGSTIFDATLQMCGVLREANIPVSYRSLHRHFEAMKALHMYFESYANTPNLMLTVEAYPDRLEQIASVLNQRGSLDAFSEIVSSSPAVAEGAL